MGAIPPQVGVVQEVFGGADVRRACIPGAGGIMNAGSETRFFAMLANGGQLDGVGQLLRGLTRCHHLADEVDRDTSIRTDENRTAQSLVAPHPDLKLIFRTDDEGAAIDQAHCGVRAGRFVSQGCRRPEVNCRLFRAFGLIGQPVLLSGSFGTFA